MKDRAIFFDRDGTIIVEKEFISDPGDVELIPNSADALRRATRLGYKLFVISNQSGVARGIMTLADVENVNQRLVELVSEENIVLDGIFYCPHYPSITGDCNCRKPKRGMIDQALISHELDLSNSFVVGDRKIDIELGFNVGAKSVLVLTGYGSAEVVSFDMGRKPDFIANDILDAVKWIEHHG